MLFGQDAESFQNTGKAFSACESNSACGDSLSSLYNSFRLLPLLSCQRYEKCLKLGKDLHGTGSAICRLARLACLKSLALQQIWPDLFALTPALALPASRMQSNIFP